MMTQEQDHYLTVTHLQNIFHHSASNSHCWHHHLLFWLMIFSPISRFCFGNAYDFVFVAVRFFLLYALVFYVYCRVLPDVLSCTPTGVSEINYLTLTKNEFWHCQQLFTRARPTRKKQQFRKFY